MKPLQLERTTHSAWTDKSQGDELAEAADLLRRTLSTAAQASRIAEEAAARQSAATMRIGQLQREALEQITESAGEAVIATEVALRDVVAARPLVQGLSLKRQKPPSSS
jgi:hypothetical protein